MPDEEDEEVQLTPENMVAIAQKTMMEAQAKHVGIWNSIVNAVPKENQGKLTQQLIDTCGGHIYADILTATVSHLASIICLAPEPMVLLETVHFALQILTANRHAQDVAKAMAEKPAKLN